MLMGEIEKQLANWGNSLCPSVNVGELLARSETVHKWKATYRSLVVREALMWRMHDLGLQTVSLTKQQHYLGARILLRSALETLAILIYLNQKTEDVVDGNLEFFDFEEVTMQLLMGSRNEATSKHSVNILTALQRADKVHDGLVQMHESLSESAHPNYDGVMYGYSKSNPQEFETAFCNNWIENFATEQEPATAYVLALFEHQYNEVWPSNWERLEGWLEENGAALGN
jgi:hypothetical protein